MRKNERVRGLSWHSQSHDQLGRVFWEPSHMRHGGATQLEAAGRGSFPSPTNPGACVCVQGQYNGWQLAVGVETGSLTFAKWELIHFVNVLFCTASCSSVNQRLTASVACKKQQQKKRKKTQTKQCTIYSLFIVI